MIEIDESGCSMPVLSKQSSSRNSIIIKINEFKCFANGIANDETKNVNRVALIMIVHHAMHLAVSEK